jgi:SPP1 gp7 family putative phage head morphogenesis protein
MAQAPKRAPKATVNETLRDRGVAHAVYLERLKAHEGERVAKQLRDEVLPDLVDRLTMRLGRIEQRGYDWDAAGTVRLAELVEFIQETVDAWTTGLAADLATRSTDIAAAEVKWQDDLLQEIMPIAWDTVMPATSILAAAITNSPIDGVLLADIVARLGTGTKNNLEKAIRIGIAEGESIDRMRARIRRVTDFSVDTANAVARTAVGHASNMGRQTYYADNQDLIKGVKWVATLDTRTCSICMALDDGKLLPIDKGPRPPRHINCRCTTVPVLRSMKELGFDLDDFPAATRASMNGQVPDSETFGTWLAKMPASIQDEALGPTRGKLFRTGELKVGDFVDRQGDPYNLDQLKQRESEAWRKARL